MRAKWLALVICLAIALSACTPSAGQSTPVPPVSTPSDPVDDPPVTPPHETTEIPTETETSLPLEESTESLQTELDLGKLGWTGGVSDTCYAFLYDDSHYNYLFLGESAVAQIKELELGYVYVMDNETQNFIRVLDEPAVGLYTARNYLFCITAANTVVVTDMAGEFKQVLYEAQEQLQPKSLGYLGYALFFIEGSRILKMDLKTKEVNLLIEYEGAIDADPLYGIEEEFPHLLCIDTATAHVACNLETGETAIIPETGQWGTAAFELYMEYGIWPGDEEQAVDD